MKKNKKKFDANELNDLGWLLCRLEKYEKGITFLEKALKIKPNMKKALNNLFFIQNKLKNYSETLKIAKKLSLLEPDSAEALNTLGWLQFKNNKINEAIKSFIKTTELAPDFSLAFNNLGLMFYLKNNLQSSYEWYEKASKINSSSESRAYAFNNMGLIDFKQKKFKKAEENFTKAIEIKSNYIPALNNLGILYNTLEKDNLAEKIYTRVLNYEQGTGEAHVAALQLGLLKIKNNQLEQAHILLQRVYEEAEKTISFKAGILLASIYIKQKKYTKAINTYNSILEKNINNSEIYLNIGNLYFKMKDFDNAKRSFEKSIEIDNLNINALNSLAYLLACQNIQLDKALIYSKKALNIANKNNESPDIIGSFSDTLGWIYFQKGDLKKSLHFLNEALLCFKNKKGSEEVLYHKALTLMKKGDIEKAFECLKKAITISPESEYGKKCQILLDMEQKSKK
jgi:tetratricopeptide (TPR) repeat protein